MEPKGVLIACLTPSATPPPPPQATTKAAKPSAAPTQAEFIALNLMHSERAEGARQAAAEGWEPFAVTDWSNTPYFYLRRIKFGVPILQEGHTP